MHNTAIILRELFYEINRTKHCLLSKLKSDFITITLFSHLFYPSLFHPPVSAVKFSKLECSILNQQGSWISPK